MYLHFRTSTPSQSEIFPLNSCYCDLLSLLVWSAGPFRTSTPSQTAVRNILSKLLLCACSVYLHFRTSTPSQREIFSQSCYCVLARVEFPFQDQHTLPKRNIPSHSCYCDLLCSAVYSAFQDQHTLPALRNILSKFLLWLVLSAHIAVALSGPSHPNRSESTYFSKLLNVACCCVPGISGPLHTSRETIFQQ